MPLTRTEARDEILALVKGVVDLLSDFIAIYDDSRTDVPDQNVSPLPTWARILVKHGPGGQSSLSNHSGIRQYTKTGILAIQLFTPAGKGMKEADVISEQFESALRNVSTPNGVWFREVRTNEIGVDGPWFQNNILASFEYDQVG